MQLMIRLFLNFSFFYCLLKMFRVFFALLFLFNAFYVADSYSTNPESYDFFPTHSNHLPAEDANVIKFSENKPIFYLSDSYSRQYRVIFPKNESDWTFTLFFDDQIPSVEPYAIFMIDFVGEKPLKFEVVLMEEPLPVYDQLFQPFSQKLIKLLINNENLSILTLERNSTFPKELTFTIRKDGVFGEDHFKNNRKNSPPPLIKGLKFNETHNFVDVSFAKYFVRKLVMGDYIISFQMKSSFHLAYPNSKHPNFKSTEIQRSQIIYYFNKDSVMRFTILTFATIFPFFLFVKILKKFQYATVESEVHLYKLSHRINRFDPRILKYKQALNKLEAEEIFYKKKIAIMARELGFDIPQWYWDPHYWEEMREHRKKHLKIHKEFLQVMAGKIKPPEGWYPEFLRTDLFPERKEGDEDVTKKSKKASEIDKTQISTVE